MGLFRAMAALAAGAVLAGCISSTPRLANGALVDRIGADAATFNEAYARAVNAQILLNILRSRDRQPRYYLATSGISDAPSYFYGDNLSLGGVAVGKQAGKTWGVGSIGAQRQVTTRPSYAVQPLDAHALPKAVFDATPINVFAHYWENGWPRDILMLLMVDKLGVTRNGKTEQFTNEANDIRDDCRPGVTSIGCGYVAAMRAFLDALDAHALAPPGGRKAQPVCGLVEAYDPSRPVRAGEPGAREPICPATFIVGDTTYRLDLRSFDDMVYYVGELMRAAYTEGAGDPKAPMDARVDVKVAGLKGGGKGTPLFRILPLTAVADSRGYTAKVTYEGATYVAGPPIGRSCAQATARGLCQDDPAHGDRSSSVLSLLAELLALNQSPESIRPPARLVAE